MKLGLFMWYDEAIRAYGDINYKINKMYCDKHNIELIVSHEKRFVDRHPAWERLPLLLHHIRDFDYVMWLDADAHFYVDGKNIADFIVKHNTYPFIFSRDEPPYPINTGFFIIKNTSYSIDVLNRWCYDDVLYKNNNYPQWWDQGVLIDMFVSNILNINNSNNCILIDYGILQHFSEDEHFESPFVFHLADKSTEERIKHSQNYLEKCRNKIDF